MTWVFFVIVGCGGKKGGRKRKMFCGEQRPVRVGDKRLGVGEETFFFARWLRREIKVSGHSYRLIEICPPPVLAGCLR